MPSRMHAAERGRKRVVNPATNGIRDDPANHAEAAPPVASPITIASGTTIQPIPAASGAGATACMTPWMTPSCSIGTSVSTAPVTSRYDAIEPRRQSRSPVRDRGAELRISSPIVDASSIPTSALHITAKLVVVSQLTA